MEGELNELGQKARLPGFRPARFRRSISAGFMASRSWPMSSRTCQRGQSEDPSSDHGFKLAMEPAVNFPQDKDKLDAVMAARGDLEYTVAVGCCRNSRSPTTATSPSRSSGGGS